MHGMRCMPFCVLQLSPHTTAVLRPHAAGWSSALLRTCQHLCDANELAACAKEARLRYSRTAAADRWRSPYAARLSERIVQVSNLPKLVRRMRSRPSLFVHAFFLRPSSCNHSAPPLQMLLIDIVNLFSLPGDLDFAFSQSFVSDSNRRAYLEYRCVHSITTALRARGGFQHAACPPAAHHGGRRAIRVRAVRPVRERAGARLRDPGAMSCVVCDACAG